MEEEQRQREIPNQYQIIEIGTENLRRWTRQYAPEHKNWIGDNRASEKGNVWWHKQTVAFESVNAICRSTRKRSRITTIGKQGSIQLSLSSLLPSEKVDSFVALLRNDELQRALRSHFENLNVLGIETPENEDSFLAHRKEVFQILSRDMPGFICVLKDYWHRNTGVSEMLIAHEIGRILTDNRQVANCYDILRELERYARRHHRVLGQSIYLRLLDSIGEAARFADDYEGAERLYREVLSIDPDYYFSLKHLATICRIKNDHLQAEQLFRQALNSHRSHHLLFSLGYLFHDSDNYRDAESLYKKCVAYLESQGIEDYYRVYLKLAYIQIIRKATPLPLSYLTKVLGIAEEKGNAEPFLHISCFTANLLLALIYDTEVTRAESIAFCKSYVMNQLDFVTHSVFYCVYNDICRILANRPDLHPAKQQSLTNLEKENLNDIFSRLYRKHIQLQACQAHKAQSKFPSEEDTLVVLLHLYRNPSFQAPYIQKAINAFDSVNQALSETNLHNSFHLFHSVIGNRVAAIKNLRTERELLLDHGSFFLGHLCHLLALSHPENLCQPFTAIMPKEIQKQSFSDHFFLDISQHEGFDLHRVLSKKLMCFDYTGRNRIFINPAVGCKRNCTYCYLPEYGIPNDSDYVMSNMPGVAFSRALQAFPVDEKTRSFAEGKHGTLLSIGSFCDPFLPDVANTTVEILKALRELGNPLQVATKFYPDSEVLIDLLNAFSNQATPIMIYLSTPELNDSTRQMMDHWLAYSNNIALAVYLKPFLDNTLDALDDFVAMGRKYPNISFIVGSFYMGERILRNLDCANSSMENYRKDTTGHLISPVVSESVTPGYLHAKEAYFCDQLRKEFMDLGITVFRTASCALSAKYAIPDPLGNFGGFFCVGESCPNLRICETEMLRNLD
ncbi:MAG: tetratricopeptide repeat protein [Thermodesulfobacteriota bacterium]|nr:tetratricopeptide repeat protein [Thermodesulfobacteriota bacterium]